MPETVTPIVMAPEGHPEPAIQMPQANIKGKGKAVDEDVEMMDESGEMRGLQDVNQLGSIAAGMDAINQSLSKGKGLTDPVKTIQVSAAWPARASESVDC